MIQRAPLRERGQAIGLAAVVMVAMVGMVAFVIDAGLFIMTRHELQKAVDAGAMAAMIDLAPDPTSAANQSAALTSATSLTTQNLGIASRLCTAQAPTFVAPTPRFGTYTLDITQGGGIVYTVTVTVECRAGYTFGRILNLTQMTISATGTAAIGSVRTTDCPFPIAIQQLSPGDPNYKGAENFGWGYGAFTRMKIAPASDSTANASSICLTSSNCGASDMRDWIATCTGVPFSLGEQSLREMGGSANMPVGPVAEGFRQRQAREIPGIPDNIPGNYMDCMEPSYPVSPKWAPDPSVPNAKTAARHPQQTSSYPVVSGFPNRVGPVISTNADPELNWRILRPSPCLASFPVLRADTVQYLNGGGMVDVIGFALFYVLYFDKGNPACPGPESCIAGYYVRPALSGELGLYNPDGQPIWRLIR